MSISQDVRIRGRDGLSACADGEQCNDTQDCSSHCGREQADETEEESGGWRPMLQCPKFGSRAREVFSKFYLNFCHARSVGLIPRPASYPLPILQAVLVHCTTQHQEKNASKKGCCPGKENSPWEAR
jgi:hypothetical protein